MVILCIRHKCDGHIYFIWCLHVNKQVPNFLTIILCSREYKIKPENVNGYVGINHKRVKYFYVLWKRKVWLTRQFTINIPGIINKSASVPESKHMSYVLLIIFLKFIGRWTLNLISIGLNQTVDSSFKSPI